MSEKYDTTGSTSPDVDNGSDDDGLATTSQTTTSTSDSDVQSGTDGGGQTTDGADTPPTEATVTTINNNLKRKRVSKSNDKQSYYPQAIFASLLEVAQKRFKAIHDDGDGFDNSISKDKLDSNLDDKGSDDEGVSSQLKLIIRRVKGEDVHSDEVIIKSNDGGEDNDDEDNDDAKDDEDDDEKNTTPKDKSILDGNMQVVATHYNELKESGRKERVKSKIFHMRNFNNWIKSQLINEYMSLIKGQEQNKFGVPIRVLDMCCGKGGDLLKWEKANVTHLICTDIADVSVEQCQKRYNDMLARAEKFKYSHTFTAEFFACDSTLVRLRQRYKDPTLELNLVSCQFAFHYSFESLTQADCMVRNAAECLKPGGYFIATIPDAYEIMRRLRKSPNGKSFGNDVYNIEFLSDTNPPPLFGAKYQFHLEGVVDCPEFLVYFPTLVKLCRKHGLKLVRRTTFADYCKETLKSGRSLLHRMNGLESVNYYRCGDDEQFRHVRNYVGPNRAKPFGTLSKAEWEATTLYLVCAFQKCKSTWDSKGMPVFNFD